MRAMETQWRIPDSRPNEHVVYNSYRLASTLFQWIVIGTKTVGIEMKSSVCKNCSTDPRLEQKQRI